MRHAILLVIRFCTGAAIAALSTAPAAATTFFPQRFACPIGGERFEAQVVGSNTTFGSRPDGMPYSPMPVLPLVECPSNGFILFDEKYTPAELAALKIAVASPEYQAMRQTEGRHYRAWWLMRAAARDPFALASAMLTASWEAEPDAVRKARYQAQFVEAAAALEPGTGDADRWFWLNLRLANALRELGRFDEAHARLDRIDQTALLPASTDQRDYARYMIDGLRALATERNTVSEPANLVPPMIAERRCKQSGLTPSEITACIKVKAALRKDATARSSMRKTGSPIETPASDAADEAEAAAYAAAKAAIDAARASKR